GSNYGVFRKRLIFAQNADFPLCSVREGASHHSAGRNDTVFTDDGMADNGARCNADVGHNDAVVYEGAGADGAAGGNDGMPHGTANLAAFGDEAVDGFGPFGNIAGGQRVVPSGNFFAFGTAYVEVGMRAQQVHIGFPQRVD